MKKIMFMYLFIMAISYCDATYTDVFLRYFEADHDEDTQYFYNNLKKNRTGEMLLEGKKEITKIPDHLDLPKVKTLFLRGNSIEEIPASINIPQLEKLYLNRNNISKFDKDDLKQLLTQFPKLKYLNLTGNPLGQLDMKGLRETARKAGRSIEIIAKNTDPLDLIEIEYESIEGD